MNIYVLAIVLFIMEKNYIYEEKKILNITD